MRSIPEHESLKVEFKSDLKRYPDTELVEEIVGMANTKGGELYLGVEDDGRITGVNKIHKDEIGLIALVANKTMPSLQVQAEIITEDSTDVLKINIPLSHSIIATTDGKILKRRLKLDGTPENVPMYPYEITTRLTELSRLDFSVTPLLEASLDDFDPNQRNKLRELIKTRKGDEALLDLTDEELDHALQLIKDVHGHSYPTVLGMLMIGKESEIQHYLPTATATFQVLDGTNVKVNESFHKPLLETFKLFETYLKPWNPEREMEQGLFRLPIPEFSNTAFREGLVNAFCHRDYTILQSVRVLIDDDGLTISSPGGFIEGVNLENLLTVEPHGRNPALADALKRIGLAERTGRGIDRIYEGSIVFGRPLPDYSESTERVVKLFIQRAKPDIAFSKMIANEENRLGKSLPINSLLILSTLQNLRRATLEEISQKIHIGKSRTQGALERLVESGLIEAHGNGRSRVYHLSSKVYKEQNNLAGYVRQSGIDEIRYEELIMKLLVNQGYVTRKDIVNLLNISPSQAYRLLKKLTEDNKIELEGYGRKSRYVIKNVR